jgi:hypothetical protein
MNWKQKLAEQAKKTIDARGGTESLKGDAQELRDIARGQGSARDKLKAAAQAIKTPGASDAPAAGSEAPAAEPQAAQSQAAPPEFDAAPPEFES